MNFKVLLFFCIVFFTSNLNLRGQGNACSGATSLTVNGTCGSGTVSDATVNDPTYSGTCTISPQRDAWFSFTATQTTASIVANSGNRQLALAIYSGSCGSLTQIGCANANTTAGAQTETVNLTGLTIGATYYVRVINEANNNMNLTSLCIITPPSNDDCSGATVFPAIPTDGTCSNLTNQSTSGATNSNVTPSGSCTSNSGTPDDDVWFTFTATTTSLNLTATWVSGNTDVYWQVFSGACSGTMNSLLCTDNNAGGLISGLTIGNVYKIRLYTWSSSGNTIQNICLSAPPPPPSNDNCSGATPFPAIPTNGTCSTLSNQSTANATASSVTPTGACTSNAGTPDDDVWFSFVATTTTVGLSATYVSGSSDVYWQVFSGSCSGTMTSLLCTDNDAGGVITGLTIGQTYYIKMYSYFSASTSVQNICLSAPPANDNCSGAISFPAVPTNGTCSTLSNQSTANASNSNVTPSGACTSNSGTPDDDVWFSFVATATSINLTATYVSGNTDVYWQVFSSSCSSTMTSILCTDNNTGGLLTGLTVGQTYYIRLYTWSSSGSTTQTICLSTPPPPPSNDNPCAATPVTVNTGITCSSTTNGTTTSATATGTAMGSCFGTADDDVWFSFVATNSTQTIALENISGSTTDMYFSVHAGTCGSIGAAVLCSDPETGTVTGLTVGTTYFVRVYTYTSTTGQNTNFTICITPPPPVPSNDNPCGATSVTVNTTFNCASQTSGTVAGATATGTAMGSCFGTADDDVWFSFVANNSTQYISLNNITGSTTDMYFSVHPGTCGSIGAALLCSDPQNNIVTGLTVGTTYFIRVYTYTGTTGQTSSFDLCITPPPPVPTNDEPCSATDVPVNASSSCSLVTPGTVGGATSSGIGLGACFGTADDDVWFSFVANSTSQNITLMNVAGSTTDLYHSVYSGTCSSLGTAIVCSDPNSSTVTGLIVGNTYYVRVYSYTSTTGQTTSFNVCIMPVPPPPTNVTCPLMQPICSGSPIVFQAQAGGGSAATGPNYGCLSTKPNPTWFYMEIATPGTMAIDLTANSDVDFALWGPYSNLTAAQSACNAYPSPLDCSYSSSNIEQMNIASVTAGQVYAVLVTNYANVVQNINLNQALSATATTNCSIVLPVSLVSFNASLTSEQTVKIDWITESEVDCDYFDVERSQDGINWMIIHHQKGSGSSSSQISYKAFDTNPLSGISYYRLKQVDFNGKTNYYQAVSIDLSNVLDGILGLAPNPTKSVINLSYNSVTEGVVRVDLLNYSGQIVYSKQLFSSKGMNNALLDLESLDNGMYLVKVTIETNGKVLISKMIKN